MESDRGTDNEHFGRPDQPPEQNEPTGRTDLAQNEALRKESLGLIKRYATEHPEYTYLTVTHHGLHVACYAPLTSTEPFLWKSDLLCTDRVLNDMRISIPRENDSQIYITRLNIDRYLDVVDAHAQTKEYSLLEYDRLTMSPVEYLCWTVNGLFNNVSLDQGND